jgi:hypothetical protein
MNMDAILAAVFNAPLPSLMVVAGLFFLLLSIVSKVGGAITVSPRRQKISVVIGAVLLVLGLFLHFKDVLFAASSSPQETVAEYIHLIDSKQLDKAKKLHPSLKIEAVSRWMESASKPDQAIQSVNLVEFLAQEVSASSASVTAKIRYCRMDGSGTDEEKIFFLKQTDERWLVQSANQPKSVKQIRCF